MHSHDVQQHKRRSLGGQPRGINPNLTTSAPIPSHVDKNVRSPLPTAMEIGAYGLEDRAEAIIGVGGKEGWGLIHLSRWRQELAQRQGLTASTAQPGDVQTFLRQRQRAYRQHLLKNSTS